MTEDVHVKIDASKKHKYEELDDDRSSIFYKNGRTTIFIAAACVGYYKQERVPLPSGKDSSDLFITSTLGSENSEKLWILKSIAMAELGIDALKDLKAAMAVCQEFANSGIEYLYDIHRTPDVDEAGEYARMMKDILEEELDCSERRSPVQRSFPSAFVPFRWAYGDSCHRWLSMRIRSGGALELDCVGVIRFDIILF